MTHEEAIQNLTCKSLPIEEVYSILEAFKMDVSIEASVAMNLSLRTSVYDASLEKSELIVTMLERLAHSADMSVRWAVAKNPHTPVGTLELLSKDSVNLVRALVATNINTPKPILQLLFNDEKIVRDGLSGNPSTPLKLLFILADDSDAMVRMRVLENPSCTKELCERLLNDSAPNVHQAAHLKYKRFTDALFH